MDPLGIQKDLDEMKALLNQQQDRIAGLEAQVAKDVNTVADKVIAAVLPEVRAARESIDQVTLVISSSVTEALALMRRLDGATVSGSLAVKLAPEAP